MTLDLRKTEYFHLEEEEEQKESGADFSEFANLYEREILTSKINDRFGNPIQQYDLFMTLFGVKMLDDKDEEANAQNALLEAADRAKRWSRNKKIRTDKSADWLRRTERSKRPQLAAVHDEKLRNVRDGYKRGSTLHMTLQTLLPHTTHNDEFDRLKAVRRSQKPNHLQKGNFKAGIPSLHDFAAERAKIADRRTRGRGASVTMGTVTDAAKHGSANATLATPGGGGGIGGGSVATASLATGPAAGAGMGMGRTRPMTTGSNMRRGRVGMGMLTRDTSRKAERLQVRCGNTVLRSKKATPEVTGNYDRRFSDGPAEGEGAAGLDGLVKSRSNSVLSRGSHESLGDARSRQELNDGRRDSHDSSVSHNTQRSRASSRAGASRASVVSAQSRRRSTSYGSSRSSVKVDDAAASLFGRMGGPSGNNSKSLKKRLEAGEVHVDEVDQNIETQMSKAKSEFEQSSMRIDRQTSAIVDFNAPTVDIEKIKQEAGDEGGGDGEYAD